MISESSKCSIEIKLVEGGSMMMTMTCEVI